MEWEQYLEFGELSDVGMRRSNNQDNLLSHPTKSEDQLQTRGHLFVVADGMGAHAVGELASKLAVDSIPHAYHKLTELPCDEAIEKAFVDANTEIHGKGTANPEFKSMGTTATALILLPTDAYVAHVGDSRAYRIRAGKIEQLSFDHSYVWEYARRQRISREDAAKRYPSNVITRSLGPEAHVEIDIEGPHQLEVGDIFVLCSDGLSGPVDDPEIGVLAGNLPPQTACQCLVDLANLRGGSDNITVQVIRIKRLPSADTETAPATATGSSTLSNGLLIGGLIGLLAAAGLAAVQSYVPAGFAGALALVCTGVGAIVRPRKIVQTQSASPTTNYEEAKCDLGTLWPHLQSNLDSLCELAVQDAWPVQHGKLEQLQTTATAHAAGSRESLDAYAEVIRTLAHARKLQKEETERLLDS